MAQISSTKPRPKLRWVAAGLYVVLIGSVLASMAAPSTPSNPSTLFVAPQTSTLTPAIRATQTYTPRMAMQQLQALAKGSLSVQWSARFGIPTFINAEDAKVRVPYTPSAAERGKPFAIALGFLDANRALFRLNPKQDGFQLLRIEPDTQLGYAHVRLAQTYKNIPVFASQMVVHLDKNEEIVAVNGQFKPELVVETTPILTQADAEALAQKELRESILTQQESATAKISVFSAKTELTVYVDRENKPTLTWLVKVLTESPRGQWQIFVNARRPVITHSIDFSHSLKRRVTFTARNGTDIPGRKVIDEGQRSNDPIVQAAHDGAGKVYDFYFKNFQRDSIDGAGLPLVSTVNYGSDPSEAENAAWISEAQQMIYGDGGRMFKPLPYGLDVVGHEFTHGVTSSSADLIYEEQAGALNESYSDVFGVLIAGSDWTVGGTVIKSPPYPLPYLRSLSDPNANGYYDQNNPLQGVGQPRTMNEYARLPVSRRYDNGGVHINSGIPNYVAYLIGTEIGRDKLAQIYYRTLTQYLTQESRFDDAYKATLQAAKDLYGNAEVAAVQKAFTAVGIADGNVPEEQPKQQQGGRGKTPAQVPAIPQGCTNVVANSSFESDESWQQLIKGGTGLIDTENPHSGARSAWLGGQDQESPSIIVQDVQVPANATKVVLNYQRFLHQETKGLFGALTSQPAQFGVILVAPSGEVYATLEKIPSTQADEQWTEKIFDVSTLAGKKVRIVFATENPRGNISSMFVDDVSLLACTTGDVQQAPQTDTNDQVFVQGTVVNNDTGRGIAGAKVFILKPGVSARQAATDDNLSKAEVLTAGVTDDNGEFTSEEPIDRGQTYSAIIIARGFRPVIADDGLDVPSDAENPFIINATMRKSAWGLTQ